jgi:8-oxo-dGTP diphosphatase
MNYVVGFLFSPDRNRVVLIKKNKPEWQAGNYNGVGGKVEKDETYLDAMKREFKEETGVTIDEWIPYCTLSSDSFPDDMDSWAIRFFYATGNVDEVQSITSEQVDVLDTTELPEKVVPNLKWLIPMALSQKSTPCDYTVTEIYG